MFCLACALNLSFDIHTQEIPETRLSTGPFSSIRQDEDPIIENVQTANRFTSTVQRKRNIELQDSSRKKLKQTEGEPASMDDASLLATWIEAAQQDLESEKEKVRVLKKEIDTLKEARKMLINRLKARQDTAGDRGESIAMAQDHGKVLEKRVGRKELAIAIFGNVLKLSRLPFEDAEV